MLKTPDEIKKGMHCCSEPGYNCNECPYVDEPVSSFCKITRTKDALEYIQQLEAKAPRWISVEERLPDAHVLVLCVWLDGRDRKQNRGFATYQHHGVWYVSNEGMPEVTHWMPLPEPPKEE